MMISEMLKGRDYLPIEQQRSGTIAGQIGGTIAGQIDEGSTKFSDTLSEFVQDVNTLEKDSSKQTNKMIMGEPVDIHDVMIAAEKAKTSFSLLMELRNKALDMYREVIRIQV